MSDEPGGDQQRGDERRAEAETEQQREEPEQSGGERRCLGGGVPAPRRQPVLRARGHRAHEQRHRRARARHGRRSAPPPRAPGPARLAMAPTRSRTETMQRHDAIGAAAAVAHDLELALFGCAAAEAVRRVGKPVLVQAAGDERGGRDGERGRRRRGGRPKPSAEPIDQRAERADHRADDREGPCGLRQVRRAGLRQGPAAACKRLGPS